MKKGSLAYWPVSVWERLLARWEQLDALPGRDHGQIVFGIYGAIAGAQQRKQRGPIHA
jgi:hypothetical protein